MMKKTRHQLICHHTGEVLFSGWFDSLKSCVEAAVRDHINLDGVDLRGANLSCANLDDGQFAGANFTDANLNGANLSESIFDNAIMKSADLSHACLALSSVLNVNMDGASFGQTDVTDAVISGCQFSCPSVFTTSFYRAAKFHSCSYIHGEIGALSMSKPPVVINGLVRDIVYLDNIVKIGMEFVSKGDLIAAGDRHLEFLYGREIASFLRPVLYESFVFY